MNRLPDDLVINHIFPCLDLRTRIRLAAVSKLWRALSRLAPLPAIADLPWIIGFFGPELAPSLLHLNHLGDPFLTRPPEITDGHFRSVGAVDDHVILVGGYGNCVALYSPFSGETRRIIPHLTGIPDGDLRVNLVRILHESGLVVASDYYNRLYVARLGHYDWVDLDLPQVHDFIFHKGQLFCISDCASIFAFNIQQLLDDLLIQEKKLVSCDTIEPFIIDDPSLMFLGLSLSPLSGNPYDYASYNLVESEGELFVITRWGLKSQSLNDNDCIKFNVRKMDFQSECIASTILSVPLVDVFDLGKTSLFLKEAGSVSFQFQGAMRESSDFWANNCIYFIHKDQNNEGDYSLGKFCMEGVETNSSVAIFHPQRIKSFIPPFWIRYPSNSMSMRS